MGYIDKFSNSVKGGKVRDFLKGSQDKITGVVQKVTGYAGGLFNAAVNGSAFIGLNYDAVPTIRESIRQYVKNIQTAAEELNTSADSTQAVKGEIADATKTYVAAVKNCLDAYATQLLAYSDKMQEYYEAYAQSDTNLSGNVSDEAKGLEGSVDTYTEQK